MSHPLFGEHDSGPNAAKIPAVVADYFGRPDHHPVIVEVFRPGVGWKYHGKVDGSDKRISVSWARKMKAEGITHVGLSPADGSNRVADFSVDEIIRGGT